MSGPVDASGPSRASGPIPAVRLSGTTRLVGLIGWPVERTLSPVIHNAAFAALGMDWAYVALPVLPDRVPEAVAGLAALGFAGVNVTMPHKEAVAPLMSVLSDDAARLQAVNTVDFSTAAGPAGHNTDVMGFARFLSDDAAYDAAGRTALVLGAGGAARACALALARAGATSIPVADPDALPLPPLSEGMLVVDLRYRPPVTPLVARAHRSGAAAFGGLGMLMHQAGLSFELWTGQVPPAAAMSAAALAAMAEPLV